jgi:hypothetical protein
MGVIYRTSDKAAPGTDKRADFPTPSVMRDIAEYTSPIDGKPISSRSTRREDLKANDCVEWEPGIGKKAGADKRTPGLYKNAKFAKKHNLPLAEEAREKLKSKG